MDSSLSSKRTCKIDIELNIRYFRRPRTNEDWHSCALMYVRGHNITKRGTYWKRTQQISQSVLRHTILHVCVVTVWMCLCGYHYVGCIYLIPFCLHHTGYLSSKRAFDIYKCVFPAFASIPCIHRHIPIVYNRHHM